MPPLVPWMTRADDYILRLLERTEVAMPPKAIALNLRREHGQAAPSRKHVARRLRNELTEHGLVTQPFEGEARGYYAITDLGRRYFHDSDAEPAEFVAGMDDTTE
jgi:DNA-binding PadR family transcriptional regulator